MGGVSQLSIMDVVPWGLAVAALIAAGYTYNQLRIVRSGNEFSIIDAIGQLSEATKTLRAGLDADTADRVTSYMRMVLDAVAVGITDKSGTLDRKSVV